MYDKIMARQAQRSLDRLPKKDSEAILDRIDDLAHNPWPRGVEKIKGAVDLWRVRQGDYRVIYIIDDEKENYHNLGHRPPP